jgi:hypothetical protein
LADNPSARSNWEKKMEQITTKTDATRTQEATKDSGRVRLGAGNIQFSDPTPAREATKDAGRVRMGAGNIQF